jgi:hypothetical protein
MAVLHASLIVKRLAGDSRCERGVAHGGERLYDPSG